MKVRVEIECTPEEARRAMGLPDLSAIHERYTAKLQDAVDGQIRPEAVEALIRQWAPMGEAGLALWRRMVEGGDRPS